MTPSSGEEISGVPTLVSFPVSFYMSPKAKDLVVMEDAAAAVLHFRCTHRRFSGAEDRNGVVFGLVTFPAYPELITVFLPEEMKFDD